MLTLVGEPRRAVEGGGWLARVRERRLVASGHHPIWIFVDWNRCTVVTTNAVLAGDLEQLNLGMRRTHG
jgi:hypothetical protein